MPKTAIIYDSTGRNTRAMAEILADEFGELKAPCGLFHVDDFKLDTLPGYDGFVVGTPNYFGGMSAKLKKFFDESVKFFNKLDGKAGAAFCSTGMIGGGGETAILAVLKAMLIHGMVVQGNTGAGHYGVLSIGKPDERVEKELRQVARRFVALLKKITV
jgi:NAD(P)H dehydrogenase (quinone)